MAAAVRTVHLASSWSRQTLDDRGDDLWIVGGMDAERVPRLVIERQVVPEHDVAGIFFGPLRLRRSAPSKRARSGAPGASAADAACVFGGLAAAVAAGPEPGGAAMS